MPYTDYHLIIYVDMFRPRKHNFFNFFLCVYIKYILMTNTILELMICNNYFVIMSVIYYTPFSKKFNVCAVRFLQIMKLYYCFWPVKHAQRLSGLRTPLLENN